MRIVRAFGVMALFVTAAALFFTGVAKADWPDCSTLPWYNPCHSAAWTDPGWSPNPAPGSGTWGPNGYEPCRIQMGCR
jgi:hypothetical protein